MCVYCTYLNPAIAFWMIDSSELLSNTKDKAATVGPQIRVNKSWSNDPEGTWRKNPSLVVPLFNKTYNTTILVVQHFQGLHIFLKIHKDLDLHCPCMIFNCHATSSELIRFHGWYKFYRFLGLLNHSSMKLPSQEKVNFEKSSKYF